MSAPARSLGLAAALIVGSFAVTVVADRSSPATVEQRVDQIASGLRCPVCQDLSAADSPSPIAQAMREEIARRLRAGQDAGEIRAYFVSRYGAWILLAPRFGGLNVLPWLLPAVATSGGLLAVTLLLRRRARTEPATVTHADRQRIELELARSQEPD